MIRPIIFAIAILASVGLMLAGAGLIQSAQGSADAMLGLIASLTGAGTLTAIILYGMGMVR